MTKPNMKPYDPAHTGEFCTRDGRPVEILKRDRRSYGDEYPLIGCYLNHNGYDISETWTREGRADKDHETSYDLMCVIPKREARVIEFDENGAPKAFSLPPSFERANTAFREILPDDINQERAQAVFAAAREACSLYKISIGVAHSPLGATMHELYAALGDDV